MVEFDFKTLVSRAFFDYVGPLYPTFPNATLKNTFRLPSLSTISAIVDKNKPYFMVLQLAYKGKIFTFPNEPLVALSLKKTIVETATVGKYRKGTVKEYITTEDWNITIRGLCIDPESTDYPAKQIQLLKELFEINEAIEIHNNKFFELFGISRIVLKDLKLDEMQGQPSIQKYTITAVSDIDFLAELNPS